jgi:predicted kinase
VVLGRPHVRALLPPDRLSAVSRYQAEVQVTAPGRGVVLNCGNNNIAVEGGVGGGGMAAAGAREVRHGETAPVVPGDRLLLLPGAPETAVLLEASPLYPVTAEAEARPAAAEAAAAGPRAGETAPAPPPPPPPPAAVCPPTATTAPTAVPSTSDAAGQPSAPLVILLVGPPGSGKSTFCDALTSLPGSPYRRVNQDTAGRDGKRGTRQQCERALEDHLAQGLCVLVDRCNFDGDQRASFVNKARARGAKVHAVHLKYPTSVCAARAAGRTGHEGGVEGPRAHGIVHDMASRLVPPALGEGFDRVWTCYNDRETDAVRRWYAQQGPTACAVHEGAIEGLSYSVWPGARGGDRGGPSGAAAATAAGAPPTSLTPSKRSAADVLLGAARMDAAARNAAATTAAASHPSGVQHGGGGGGGGGGPPFMNVLRQVAADPAGAAARGAQTVLETTDQYVIIHDKYPKARHHLLVVSRDPDVMYPWDLRAEHVPLVEAMLAAGARWGDKLRGEAAARRGIQVDRPSGNSGGSAGPRELQFRLGFHSLPSLPQLHLHVISQDLDSPALKNKKHYNSFAAGFFKEGSEVLAELRALPPGAAPPPPDRPRLEALLKADLACHVCGAQQRTMPALKEHLKEHA